MQRRRPGFTLVEWLVVMGIVGLLVAFALYRFSHGKDSAYRAAIRNDLRNLVTLQEAYFNENNRTYAATLPALGAGFSTTTGVTITLGGVTATGWSASGVHRATSVRCTVTVGGGATTAIEPVCD